MKNYKKLAFLCAALMMTATLGAITACGKDTPSNSSQSPETENSSSTVMTDSSISETDSSVDVSTDTQPESSSSEAESDTNVDSSASDVENDSSSDDTTETNGICEICGKNNWNDWTLITAPTCTTDGVKMRECQEANCSGQEIGTIAARGHNYTDTNGICECGDGPIFPEDTQTPVYVNPADPASGIVGSGGDYDRYELKEGYYSFALTEEPIWLSFSVPEAGQYALYTLSGGANTTLIRYEASMFFIPPTGEEARKLDNGELYSVVNCAELYWSEEWQATYSISGNVGDIVQLRFVKIEKTAWIPKFVTDSVTAKEINGKKADNGPTGTKLTEIPYNSKYYYDEELGYYRMGTANKPGAIIYAAINKVSPRLLQNVAFTQLLNEGATLRVAAASKYTAEGDYWILDYVPFIMKDAAVGGVPGNNYQEFCNDDGLYPVNKELYNFLYLYTKEHRPANIDDSIWDNETLREQQAWLAPCYYYATLAAGDKNNPIDAQIGTMSVAVPAYAPVYYNIKYADTQSGALVSYVTVSCTSGNAVLRIGTRTFKAPFAITLETNATTGVTIAFQSGALQEETFIVTITENARGSQAQPIELTEGTTTIDTNEFISLNGESSFETHYVYKATKTGVLTISAPSDINVSVGDNGYVNGSYSVEVTAGDVIAIWAYADVDTTADITVTFEEGATLS